MSILERIRAQGGDATRDEWRIKLRRGRLTDEAVKWIGDHKPELHREIWEEADDWSPSG